MGLRCSHGYGSCGALGSCRVIWRSGLTWGYGSGLHLWAKGNPNPLPGRNQPVHSNTTPHPPSYPQTAPHVPSYPLRPHATHVPAPTSPTCTSHLAFSCKALCSCRLWSIAPYPAQILLCSWTHSAPHIPFTHSCALHLPQLRIPLLQQPPLPQP